MDFFWFSFDKNAVEWFPDCGFTFYCCKCSTASFTQKNLFGFLKTFSPQVPKIFSDTPKSFGQKNFKPDSKLVSNYGNWIGFCVPDAVLWSSAKKKPEPQLYESIQPKTFFDINGKTKIKTNKKYRISNFEIKEKEKAECPRYQINSLENFNQ